MKRMSLFALLATLTGDALPFLAPAAEPESIQVDVCVYGGTAGGVTAGLAAARRGQSVLIVEPFRHLVNDSRFQAVPMYLETPKGKNSAGDDWDQVNLAALRALMARISSAGSV